MKRICGILTLAAGMALAGCESNGSMWRSSSADHPDRAFRSTNDRIGYQTPQNNQNVRDESIGQLSRQADKMPAANLSTPDRNFVTDAAAGGMYEVQAATIALGKGTDNRVKTIAQHMNDDHTKANTQLKNLAQQKGFALDTVGLTADQRAMIDSLNRLAGSDFDREYLRQQKLAHDDTIAKFERAASTADDKDLRDWANATLPTLRDHLAMINNQPTNNIGTDR